jgi:hypothetical protein
MSQGKCQNALSQICIRATLENYRLIILVPPDHSFSIFIPYCVFFLGIKKEKKLSIKSESYTPDIGFYLEYDTLKFVIL